MKQEDIRRMNELYHLSQERERSAKMSSPNGRSSKSGMSPILRRISPRSSTIHI